jgi:hypothetical protein
MYSLVDIIKAIDSIIKQVQQQTYRSSAALGTGAVFLLLQIYCSHGAF